MEPPIPPRGVAAATDRSFGPGPGARWQALLAGRSWPWLVALLGVLLVLPSARVGLINDDYYHRAALRGSTAFGHYVNGPLDMFRFFNGDPARTRAMIDDGFVPWWTYPGLRAQFLRPLTVLTHWLDYQLWPNHPALMHVHSVLWYGILVWSVAVLYRRLQSPAWLAGLAGLLYAMDDAHGMPVGFLANRNALLSTTFGVWAIVAHHRWRSADSHGVAVAGPLLLLPALLAKEEAVAACAYVLAYALVLDRGSLARRLVTLVPYAAILIVWRVVYVALGYGVANTGHYVDPLQEPLRFLGSIRENLPMLVLGQWALPPAEIGLVVSAVTATWIWRGAVALLLVLLLLLWPLLRGDRVARYWALGFALALLPLCSTFAADRLLFFPGIGASALLARFLATALNHTARRAWPALWRWGAPVAAVVFVMIHLGIAPLGLALRSAFPNGPRTAVQLSIRVPDDARLAEQDLVVLHAPSVLHTAYFMLEAEVAGRPVPRHLRVLASGQQGITVSRTDERTLVIRPDEGFISWMFERLLRAAPLRMQVGERVALTGLTVEVTVLTDDGRPAEAAFRFDLPLEDDRLRWITWNGAGYGPWSPPPVGNSVAVPFTPLRW